MLTSNMPCILGIDPGLGGAIAFYSPETPASITVLDMPTVDGEVDASELARLIREARPAFAATERVSPMPRDGVRQAFGFGGAYAVARTVVTLCSVPQHLITPQTWKRHYRLAGGTEGKEAARALALRLFPASAAAFSRKKDHGRAEAALLARFDAQTING